MKLEDLTTIDQLVDFLSGTQAVAFSVISDKDACYRWIQGELVKFRYLKLSRQGKGVVIRYLMKISGYSRQQLTRLIAQYRKTGRLFIHRCYEHRTRYVIVFGNGDKSLRTSHPSGLRRNPSIALQPLVPRYPTQSSVPNRVQNVFTESMAQPWLSRPNTAHGLGET